MLLGFKHQFAPYVEEGSKTHTIRAERKGPAIQVGDRLDCYVDPRQKTMRLLGRFLCTKVEDIVIEWLAVDNGMTIRITIDGRELDGEEAELFAYRDGFREPGNPLHQMHRFWHKTHGHEAFPFHGRLIHWEFSPISRKVVRKRIIDNPRRSAPQLQGGARRRKGSRSLVGRQD